MTDPDPSKDPYTTRPVIIPIEERITRVIVAERDETERGRQRAGEPYTHPLPPKQEEKGPIMTTHGEEKHGIAEKIWPIIIVGVCAVLAIGFAITVFNNVTNDRPMFSHIFGGSGSGGYASQSAPAPGFNGLASNGPAPGYSPRPGFSAPHRTWHPGAPPPGRAHQCVACRPGFVQDPDTCQCDPM